MSVEALRKAAAGVEVVVEKSCFAKGFFSLFQILLTVAVGGADQRLESAGLEVNHSSAVQRLLFESIGNWMEIVI